LFSEPSPRCFDLYLTTEQHCDKIQELRDEFAEQLGQLRAELNMQRAHASKFGEVLDLPAMPIRRKSDAA